MIVVIVVYSLDGYIYYDFTYGIIIVWRRDATVICCIRVSFHQSWIIALYRIQAYDTKAVGIFRNFFVI